MGITRLDINLADKQHQQPCLTAIERARRRACSFCQNFKSLEICAGSRLRTLLDEDYRNRFSKKAPEKAPDTKEKEQDGNTKEEPSENNKKPKSGFLKNKKKR